MLLYSIVFLIKAMYDTILSLRMFVGGVIRGTSKKDNKAFSLRMDKSVYNKLSEFCNLTGQMKTVAVERALLMYMESYEKNMCERFGGRKKRVNEKLLFEIDCC